MFKRRAVQLSAVCIDDNATEISGVIDGKLFSYGDPFSGKRHCLYFSVYYFSRRIMADEHFHRASLYSKSIPRRLVEFTGHSPLGLCYLSQGILLVTYPLGIL